MSLEQLVVPKQRYNRFSSLGGNVHVTTTFEYAWATPGRIIIGSSVIFKEFFSLINFRFLTRM